MFILHRVLCASHKMLCGNSQSGVHTARQALQYIELNGGATTNEIMQHQLQGLREIDHFIANSLRMRYSGHGGPTLFSHCLVFFKVGQY